MAQKSSTQKSRAAGINAMVEPRGVAVIGASREEDRVGHGILKSLVHGCIFESNYCKPFRGKVYAVNPKADQILGVKCHGRVSEIAGTVDLAVIAVPAQIVPAVLRDCASKEVKAAIIVSAGFAELGERGKALQEETLLIARKAGIVLLGPNALGLLRPPTGLNASFALGMPEGGKIAFLTQSGALADSVVDWALEARYGFSLIASLGNSADLTVTDFLEFCLRDEKTKAIAIYVEGIKDGKKFMEVAARVSRQKPIVLVKGGKTSAGTKAIVSHTGSLAGDYSVFKAAMRQSGIFIAESIEDMFDRAKALSEQPRTKGKNIAIVTNGGGVGVLTTDYCNEYGLNVVELKPSTIATLDKTGKMHPAYSRRNPLDIIGDALPERYEAAVNALLQEDYVDGLIVVQTLQSMTRTVEDANVVVKAHARFPNKPVVCVFMGGKYTAEGVSVLRKNNIPDYNDPLKAVKVMAALCGVL